MENKGAMLSRRYACQLHFRKFFDMGGKEMRNMIKDFALLALSGTLKNVYSGVEGVF